MPFRKSSIASVVLLGIACAALLAMPAQAAPNNMVALGVGPNANTLYRFSGDSPTFVTSAPVTGLGISTLVGIDFRPATGELIGLGLNGDTTTLFVIDPLTGATSTIGSTTPASLTGATAFGLAFQPVVDRLRVINNQPAGANNFRLNPTNATSVIDASLNFSELPGGDANAPEVAVAYDRDVAGATATTLFGIVSGGDRLVRQGGVDGTPPSANTGTLFDIGPLGVDTSENAGLDIDPVSGEAYASLQVGGATGLYRIDLATGAATGLGAIGTGTLTLGSMSIGGPPAPTPPPPLPAVLESLKVNPRSFRAAKAGSATASAKRKAPVGTTVSYRLSSAAAVSFKVERLTQGRKVGGKCVKKTRANRDRKPCTRVVMLKGSFSHSGATGENRFKFRGRIGNRTLTPGSYRLRGSVGSSVRRASFKIVP